MALCRNFSRKLHNLVNQSVSQKFHKYVTNETPPSFILYISSYALAGFLSFFLSFYLYFLPSSTKSTHVITSSRLESLSLLPHSFITLKVSSISYPVPEPFYVGHIHYY